MTAFDYFEGDTQNFWKLIQIGLNERVLFFSLFGRPRTAAEKVDEILRRVWFNEPIGYEIINFKTSERKRHGNMTVITFKIYLLKNDC